MPGPGNVVILDPDFGTEVYNASGISTSDVFRAMTPSQRQLMTAMASWAGNTQGGGWGGPGSVGRRAGSLFDRDRYVTPTNIFDQMSLAYDAIENDDVVAGVLESTESLAFARMSMHAEDIDDQDIYNQIAADIDLDSRLREMWRELFTVSQFYCLPGDTMVWGPHGPKKIKEIQTGDQVWAVRDGKVTSAQVGITASKGQKRIWRLRTRNHDLRCTPDHKVMVLSDTGTRFTRRAPEFVWKRADQIVRGDVLVAMGSSPDVGGGHPAPSLDVAWILGALVADGSRNVRYRPDGGPSQFKLCVPVGPQREEWVRRIEDALDVTVDARPDRCCIRFVAPVLREWAAEVMVFKSTERFIPAWVWQAEKKIQYAFMSGYLAGDGHVNKKAEVVVSASSERLVEDLRVLAAQFGWAPTNISDPKSKGYPSTARAWRFMCYPAGSRHNVPSSYARNVFFMDESLIGRTVVESSLTDEVTDVFDIEVPGAENFIANGVVVHNCGIWWHTKEYKVNGKGRKKTVTVRCPQALTILDPLKVIPVGMPMFGREKLVWIADREEAERIDKGQSDPIMERLILGKYTPTPADEKYLNELGLGLTREHLYELNPANVFRHTATKPGYQRLASVRMKSIFKYLDMKHQLQAMDRAHLIGGTNFIVLITQGSDKNPAKPEEIAHLQASVRTVAQTPVLVGDHRLSVEIVTPKLDSTLDPKRYDTIDIRITSRLYQMFVRSSGAERSDNSDKLMKVVAAGMESRRKMLRRTLEKHLFTPMYTMNDGLRTPPKLQFHPARIALEFDSAMASFMMELRNAREISRHTLLSQFEFSQEFEADMLEREEELFDDIFQTINPNNQGQPGSGVGPAETPAQIKKKQVDEGRSGGRQGGTKNGGGAAPGTGQGKAPVKPARKAAAQEVDDDDDAQ